VQSLLVHVAKYGGLFESEMPLDKFGSESRPADEVVVANGFEKGGLGRRKQAEV
jgi:hypothetical protein